MYVFFFKWGSPSLCIEKKDVRNGDNFFHLLYGKGTVLMQEDDTPYNTLLLQHDIKSLSRSQGSIHENLPTDLPKYTGKVEAMSMPS
jgi:hypothetical protein